MSYLLQDRATGLYLSRLPRQRVHVAGCELVGPAPSSTSTRCTCGNPLEAWGQPEWTDRRHASTIPSGNMPKGRARERALVLRAAFRNQGRDVALRRVQS
jgi:hypothetical protein